jgi:hypothetical protein
MKVSDLTIDEFKKLIGEAVDEKFREFLFDPDDGLELRDEVEQRLKASLASKERISFEEVKTMKGVWAAVRRLRNS